MHLTPSTDKSIPLLAGFGCAASHEAQDRAKQQLRTKQRFYRETKGDHQCSQAKDADDETDRSHDFTSNLKCRSVDTRTVFGLFETLRMRLISVLLLVGRRVDERQID